MSSAAGETVLALPFFLKGPDLLAYSSGVGRGEKGRFGHIEIEVYPNLDLSRAQEEKNRQCMPYA